MHPADMTHWPEICCQFDHGEHELMRIQVDLSRHLYFDYPQVPERLVQKFDMAIWNYEKYWTEDPEYCPASDMVSRTIVDIGIWEPRETILALQVLSTAVGHQWTVDFGCQLGWYSLLAAANGANVTAYDADPECLRAVKASAEMNGWPIHTAELRFGPDGPPTLAGTPIRFAKVDVEGAEDEAVRFLWPTIESGSLDHLLMEISPIFADYYPALVAKIIDAGYRAYYMPPKDTPPISLGQTKTALETDLAPWRLDTLAPAILHDLVASWKQENIWFRREGASW